MDLERSSESDIDSQMDVDIEKHADDLCWTPMRSSRVSKPSERSFLHVTNRKTVLESSFCLPDEKITHATMQNWYEQCCEAHSNKGQCWTINWRQTQVNSEKSNHPQLTKSKNEKSHAT